MPSARRSKPASRRPAKVGATARKALGKRPAARPAKPVRATKPLVKPSKSKGRPAAKPAKGSATSRGSGSPGAAASGPTPSLEIPLPGGRRHVLSLSFVRDGDEFMARLETDSGHITELKNRSLDQLLTLVAGELEDLLE